MKNNQTDMPNTEGALTGVRILDLTDERAIYGAKLLADLGADVVRPEPPEGDPLRARGPHREADAGMTSLWHRYFASNRRAFRVDTATEESAAQLRQLAQAADIVLTCMHGFGADVVDVGAALEANTSLVVVETY